MHTHPYCKGYYETSYPEAKKFYVDNNMKLGGSRYKTLQAFMLLSIPEHDNIQYRTNQKHMQFIWNLMEDFLGQLWGLQKVQGHTTYCCWVMVLYY
jgi:hypothetical protein